MNHRPSASASRSGAASRRFDAVPLLDLSRQYRTIADQVLAAIERVCASQRFILGEQVEALEREITAFTGAAASAACASGTDALGLALLTLGVRPGDAIITSPFSFFASASAIARVAARPVFVDIDPATFNLDPRQVQAKLRAQGAFRCKAILPVHLYGQCADMDTLRQVAQEFEILVVEDAAQAIGATWNNARAGSMGVAAAFSFYPSKNLSAYGDAGLVTTSQEEMARHIRQLRNHGSAQRYHHDELGWNSRMDEIQAAVLRVKLAYLSKWNERRQEHAASYDRLLAAAGLVSGQATSPLRLPYRHARAGHVFHQYVIRASRRDELRSFLAERRIESEVYYPVPLHLQPSFSYLGYAAGDLPQAEQAAGEVLALPMFAELTAEEQARVVETIAEFYS
ncbi:MAG: DegT/DnrJ/EryC1/StrS family aminotransferase [Acidobacteria bacterium]|nr:DegT/DnrJ/EryC1/StrS family aminotransferase [Acidobacteriota bacterium]